MNTIPIEVRDYILEQERAGIREIPPIDLMEWISRRYPDADIDDLVEDVAAGYELAAEAHSREAARLRAALRSRQLARE